MFSKLINCKTCGAQIARSARTCPYCGAKNISLNPLQLIVVVIFLVFLVSIIISYPSTKKNAETAGGEGGPPNYEDVSKIFAGLCENSEIAIMEYDTRLAVAITYTDIDGNTMPDKWEGIISDFTEDISKGNDLALKYGFEILSAEIRANDGVILASGGDGQLVFNKYPLADMNATGLDVIHVSAADLWAAYAENTVNADNIYKGQQLFVTGTISDITQDIITKKPCVILDSEDSLGIYGIQCFFPGDNETAAAVAELRDGQTVTIVGKCEGIPLLQVQLSQCSIP